MQTFEASRGRLPVDQAFVLQVPVFAVQVLLAEHLAVLQLGQALVLQPSQHFLQLLALLVLVHSRVHCGDDVPDLGQGAGQVGLLLAPLCGDELQTVRPLMLNKAAKCNNVMMINESWKANIKRFKHFLLFTKIIFLIIKF